MPSIFTKIIKHEIPANIVWEDDEHLAILDINPCNPGHTLVIPKQETPYVFEMADEQYQKLFTAAKILAKVLKKVTGAKRIGLVIEGLGVEDHAHLHLIPINNVGELDSTHRVHQTPEELAAMAQKIKATLNTL